MIAAIFRHPNAAEAEDRIRQRERAKHAAEMLAQAIDRAKRVIDNPTGVSDANLGTACVWYMSLSRGEGGGGVHYMRADEHLKAIRLREAEARQAQETSVQVAMRHRPHMTAIAWGVAGALIVSAGFHWWVMP